MRFPELLQDVNKLRDQIEAVSRETHHLLGRVQRIENALIAAYPPSKQIFRHRPISELEEGLTDGTTEDTLF